MKAVDTSVVVAAFASWHEQHEAAIAVVRDGPLLPTQSALETYSVLTRLPPPHRAAPEVVRRFLAANFTADFAAVDPARFRDLLDEMVTRQVVGGAAYDAVIAMVAREHGATLVTCDRRATPTYQAVGVRVEYLG